jgi:hypothetical protein
MRILYIAANPDYRTSLALDREITQLQRRFLNVTPDSVSFSVYPGLCVEELSSVIHQHHPDVLHISAHGEQDELILRKESGQGEVRVDAELLRACIPTDRPPKIIYLNACNSHRLAESLTEISPVAIGSVASITNAAARSSAVSFYEHLLNGHSVSKSFELAKAYAKKLNGGDTLEIFVHQGFDHHREVLHKLPRMVARFSTLVPALRHNEFPIALGITGCPETTRQVVFFTDDENFLFSLAPQLTYNTNLAPYLCLAVRSNPVRGVIWMETNWSVASDCRLFAVGVTADGERYTTSSSLSDALSFQAELDYSGQVPAPIAFVIQSLKSSQSNRLSGVMQFAR